MSKIKRFQKDDGWDLMTFYTIYEINGEKMIKFRRTMDRADKRQPWLSWVTIKYENKQAKLLDLVEWDIRYGMEKILSIDDYNRNHMKVIEPYEAFKLANNELTIEDMEGSIELNLIDINENTPCGCYYGL